MACATQWRSGFGGRTGLDYGACMGVLRMRLPQWRADFSAFASVTMRDLFSDLQLIEGAMLGADAERRERDEAQGENS